MEYVKPDILELKDQVREILKINRDLLARVELLENYLGLGDERGRKAGTAGGGSAQSDGPSQLPGAKRS